MDLFQKFRRQKLLDALPGGRALVGCSGGPDSTALLDLLRRLAVEKRWRLVAAHVQHRLRGADSLKDQEFVTALARRFSLPLRVLAADVRARRRRSGRDARTAVEATARKLRYRALARLAHREGARVVFVAHHKDDQAETFLLNLLRGAGPSGLAGMPFSRPLSEVTGEERDRDIRLVRPLLGWRRKEILQYLRSRRLSFRIDHSNRDPVFRRNWVRLRLLPLLAGVQPRIVEKIAQLSFLLGLEKDFWKGEAARLRKKLIREPKGGGEPRLDLRRFFRYHMISRFELLRQIFPRKSFGEIGRIEERLRCEMEEGRTRAALAGQAAPHPASAPISRPKSGGGFRLRVPGRTYIKEWNCVVTVRRLSSPPRPGSLRAAPKNSACFDWDKVCADGGGKIWRLRRWRPGDHFRPFGMKGSKKLQDFFTDLKVSREMRGRVPLLEAGGKIRWLAGYRTDEESRIDGGTRRAVSVRITPA